MALAIGFLLIACVPFIISKLFFSETPDALRNDEVDGVHIAVDIKDDDRKPIIKNFRLADYQHKSAAEKADLEKATAGKVEGDIPCVHLQKDHHLYLSIFKDGKAIQADRTPTIEIIAHPSHYDDPSGNKTIRGNWVAGKDGGYTFALQRYHTQYEKYFIAYHFVKVSYTVDGEAYISLFSVCSSNAKNGTDFFENKPLKKPLPVDEA